MFGLGRLVRALSDWLVGFRGNWLVGFRGNWLVGFRGNWLVRFTGMAPFHEVDEVSPDVTIYGGLDDPGDSPAPPLLPPCVVRRAPASSEIAGLQVSGDEYEALTGISDQASGRGRQPWAKSSTPSTSTSETSGPIFFGAKLTTPMTSRPTRASAG